MEMDLEIENDTVYIKISGAISDQNSKMLTDNFIEAAKDQNVTKAVLNLKNVPTINSSGIGKLLKLFKHFDKLNGSMRISSISDSLKMQFKEIHLDKIIPIA